MSVFFISTIVLVAASGDWREKFLLAKSNPFVLAALALFTLLVIGCFYSIAPWHARFYELNKFRALLFLPFMLPIFLEEKWRRLGLLVFMLGMLIQLLGGTFISLFISPGVSTFSHDHISIGVMMAFVCFVYFHLAYQQQGKKRYLWIGLFLVTAIYLLFINTGRTGYVLFFVLLATSLFQILGWRGLLVGLLLSIFLLVFAYYASPTFKNQTTAALDNALNYQRLSEAQDHIKTPAEVTSGGLRLQWMHDSMQILKAHPVIGAGTGAYLTASQQLFPDRDVHYFSDKPHNDMFTIAVQLGAIGLLALFALYLCHGYASLYLTKPYSIFAQLLLVTMLVGGLFNSLLRDRVESNFYLYMAALCLAHYGSFDRRHPD